MRKQIVNSAADATRSKQHTLLNNGSWLDLEALAQVEVSSEDPAFPIENALLPQSASGGWRAAATGPQSILLRFDKPQNISRIFVRFFEETNERAQEFSLRWTAGERSGEVVRQQWTFSPGGATSEEENYSVELPSLTTLRLELDPDRGRNRYPATLEALRVG